ncbi:hypothetical protein, partial [Staphylococcus capitis]|uniref:hypothetical protein n=1 Tax=Staphylococcus capitis TaxID=29388 RepID=UPI003CFC185C
RFYFVHQSQAVRAGVMLRTYEFLHATFGEYLIGRLVVKELEALADNAEFHAARSRAVAPDDDFLYALLSFAALTSRTTVVRFVRDGLAGMAPSRAALLKRELLSLFHRSLHDRRSRRCDGYQPSNTSVTGRHAAWSANLTLLIVLTGGEVTAKELFPDSVDGVSWWRQICLLWRGQLATAGWNGMVHGLAVVRDWDGDHRVLRLRPHDGDGHLPPLDLQWSYAGAIENAERNAGIAKWRHYSFEDLRRHSQFLCDRTDDTVIHAAEPFGHDLDPCIGTLHALADGTAITPAHALIKVLLATDDALIRAYEQCLTIAAHGFLDSADESTAGVVAFSSALRRLLRGDEERLPREFVTQARRTLDRAVSRGHHGRSEQPPEPHLR